MNHTDNSIAFFTKKEPMRLWLNYQIKAGRVTFENANKVYKRGIADINNNGSTRIVSNITDANSWWIGEAPMPAGNSSN